ncbi:MAG: hypothetical protein R6U03_01535 [Gillisia sp.]
MTNILYITDLYYNAKGRNYYEEDLFITSRLKKHFNILIAHPQQAIAFLDSADILVFRNTGSVLGYEEYFKEFLKAVKKKGKLTFNSFDGKGDQKGKQYLLDLQTQDYPVIPTVEKMSDIEVLGNPDKYIVKLKNGADSIGMELLSREELFEKKPEGKLIQPYIDFEYEVSFYYLNNEFQYAMYAPNNDKRWELNEYNASSADLKFARQFQIWNNMERGITRVDACRTKDGLLLLVELEDLNPFLSIELLPEKTRDRFINNLVIALTQTISEKPQIDQVFDWN